MTESRAYITDQIWFPCKDCGKQITHHTIHTCSPQLTITMNPDILPTQEEWRLVCKMVKQQRELTEDEIREVADSVCHAWKKDGVGELYMTDFARAILKKAMGK